MVLTNLRSKDYFAGTGTEIVAGTEPPLGGEETGNSAERRNFADIIQIGIAIEIEKNRMEASNECGSPEIDSDPDSDFDFEEIGRPARRRDKVALW